MIFRRLSANYGVLSHAELELTPGLNVIEEPNESGKTTWCAFLRAMLFGPASAENEKYGPAYRRAGGTNAPTAENYRLLTDAVAYVCLTDGMDWGTAYESKPLKKTALYTGPKKTLDPGNDMSVCMASSFIAYLADTYGFDRVSDFCFGQASFTEAFGTDYASAYESWSNWILQTYGE